MAPQGIGNINMSAMKRQLTCAELAVADGAHQHVWDALWRGESIGRVAVFVCPGNATIMSMHERYTFALADVETPRGYTEAWRQGLLDELYYLAACRSLPGDCSPALHVPRHLHGQTQGFADLFGARVEVQPDGNFFPYPLPDDPAVIDALEARPLETSRYWTAVEWLNYARAATGGLLPFHNPVMTGPLDTANYLLGSTTLLEWVYTRAGGNTPFAGENHRCHHSYAAGAASGVRRFPAQHPFELFTRRLRPLLRTARSSRRGFTRSSRRLTCNGSASGSVPFCGAFLRQLGAHVAQCAHQQIPACHERADQGERFADAVRVQRGRGAAVHLPQSGRA